MLSIIANNKFQKSQEPFLQNLSSFVKKGSNSVKEKFSTLFKKKVKISNESKSLTNNQTNNIGENTPTPNENKKIFTIEEDDDTKVIHINDQDSDDEDEYEEDDNENVDKIQEKEPKSKDDIKEKIKENSNQISNQPPKVKEETKSDALIQENEAIDIHSFAHKIYTKGSYVDTNDIITCKFVKIKNKSKLLSMIGLSKKNIEKNYLAFFDECFLYFLKDLEVSKENIHLRKIGNKYPLKLLQNTLINRIDERKLHITLEFLKDQNYENTIAKDMYYEESQAENFIKLFNTYLKRNNIMINDEINNNHDKNNKTNNNKKENN